MLGIYILSHLTCCPHRVFTSCFLTIYHFPPKRQVFHIMPLFPTLMTLLSLLFWPDKPPANQACPRATYPKPSPPPPPHLSCYERIHYRALCVHMCECVCGGLPGQGGSSILAQSSVDCRGERTFRAALPLPPLSARIHRAKIRHQDKQSNHDRGFKKRGRKKGADFASCDHCIWSFLTHDQQQLIYISLCLDWTPPRLALWPQGRRSETKSSEKWETTLIPLYSTEKPASEGWQRG